LTIGNLGCNNGDENQLFLKVFVIQPFAVMAATTAVDPLFRGTTSKNTRGLLRIIILCTIAAAAVSARLFSVIRTPFFLLVFLTLMNELSN
jgi:hypothetical protein